MIQLSRSIESKIIAIAILLLVCQSAHASESADPIEAYLENREVELKASEYEKARSQISGDLNDDGIDDIAILYTLESIGGVVTTIHSSSQPSSKPLMISSLPQTF